MLPTEDLFACVYVLIHDLIIAGLVAIPPRPGPAPGCSDAELLTIVMVRHLLGRRSEAGFLAEVAGDWPHLFPRLPHQSEANRRARWLRGAFEQIRVALAARLPEDGCQQVDTSANLSLAVLQNLDFVDLIDADARLARRHFLHSLDTARSPASGRMFTTPSSA